MRHGRPLVSPLDDNVRFIDTAPKARSGETSDCDHSNNTDKQGLRYSLD